MTAMQLSLPDIATAMTRAEAEELARLADGKVVLEFGALLGFSTVVLAQTADMVYSVDPHFGYPLAAPRPTLTPFLANLERYGVTQKVVPILSKAENILPIIDSKSIDLVFIDITRCAELLLYESAQNIKPKVIAVHDYGIPEWTGATEAVDKFSAETGKRFRLVGTLAIFEL